GEQSSVTLTAPPTADSYPLSLHDALPISGMLGIPPLDGCRPSSAVRHVRPYDARPIVAHLRHDRPCDLHREGPAAAGAGQSPALDRKSTRLNSSHGSTSYAVFCLEKKNIR